MEKSFDVFFIIFLYRNLINISSITLLKMINQSTFVCNQRSNNQHNIWPTILYQIKINALKITIMWNIIFKVFNNIIFNNVTEKGLAVFNDAVDN